MKNFSDLEQGTKQYPTKKTECRKKPYYYKSFKMNEAIMNLEITINETTFKIKNLIFEREISFGVEEQISPEIGKIYDFGCLETAIISKLEEENDIISNFEPKNMPTREQLIDITVQIKELED